ncbi:hypothetical protein Nepgr_014147 [Nepenthes gracilis]|uniref:C2H2-type domain-containing protein n=1 Tax=Nepenthes gracilis TaxID=150966 RepID=A0AAD3SKH1_NEPGR|nr:hypothetical protein Nepgr_014147 [Nepenthes gracilis]
MVLPVLTLKRSREELEREIWANCFRLVSRIEQSDSSTASATSTPDRLFVCKTCDRKFTSFQALGGHRASHKKLKLSIGDEACGSPPAKPKAHECSICGVEFPMGQALGGHMRKHRAALMKPDERPPTLLTLPRDDEKKLEPLPLPLPFPLTVPVLKKSNSKRVLGLNLDLDLELRLGIGINC